MDNENFTEKVIKEIEKEGIHPRPRWHFRLKNWTKWASVFVALLAGGAMVAIIISAVADYDWDIFSYLDHSLIGHVFLSLPYFWLFFFLLFSATAYRSLRLTRRGYRYPVYIILSAVALSGLLLGIILLSQGFDSKIHNAYMIRTPLYQILTATKNGIWIHPEKGLLGGQITETLAENNFTLKDLKGKNWLVRTSKKTNFDDVRIREGERVKIIGKIANPGIFEAVSIRQWGEF